MAKTVVIGAPCKVNLSLDITSRREDGYHLLSSVMQTVDLYDYLLLSESGFRGIFIACDKEQLICDTTNTAYRAAQAFFRHTGIQKYAVKIEIMKNIPMEAGLGGGSSDAAATLSGLNALYGTGLSLDTLCELGLSVGADVPFCLKGGTVLCEGVGEVFTVLPPLPACFILIAKPERGISTMGSFRRYDATSPPGHPATPHLVESIRQGDLAEVASHMYNVLESVCDLPEIALYKQIMTHCGALGAVMTGSGSAVIGLFKDKRSARHAQRKLMTHADAVFITRPVKMGARVTSL